MSTTHLDRHLDKLGMLAAQNVVLKAFITKLTDESPVGKVAVESGIDDNLCVSTLGQQVCLNELLKAQKLKSQYVPSI